MFNEIENFLQIKLDRLNMPDGKYIFVPKWFGLLIFSIIMSIPLFVLYLIIYLMVIL